MTRRQGIIAALLSVLPHRLYSQLDDNQINPCGAILLGRECLTSGPNGEAVAVTHLGKRYDIQPLKIKTVATLKQYTLEVRYKNRVMHLTGDEIMDALEGVCPNGHNCGITNP